MAKKTFAKGIDAILGGYEEPEEKESKQTIASQTSIVNEIQDTNHIDLEEERPAEVRTTVLIEADIIEKIRAFAYWDRKLFKDIVNESMSKYIASKDPEDVQKAINSYRLKQASKS